jgi:tellurite resistance protein
MTNGEVVEALRQLGLDEDSWRAVTLLPLVQVAWADGSVQAPERARILERASEAGLLDGPSGRVVRDWLQRRPSPGDLELGRRVLVALVHRHRGPGAEAGPDLLADVERSCVEVARAAGGIFDLAFTVDEAERAVLREIHQALSAESEAVLDDLPSPDGGAFRDL